MTNKELHDKFQQMMSGQVQDVLNTFKEAMEKMDGIEKTFETKLDNKFNELLAHLPPPSLAALMAPDRGKGVTSFDEMVAIVLEEVDFDDPTTNMRGRRALAIAKPTPRGY